MYSIETCDKDCDYEKEDGQVRACGGNSVPPFLSRSFPLFSLSFSHQIYVKKLAGFGTVRVIENYEPFDEYISIAREEDGSVRASGFALRD